MEKILKAIGLLMMTALLVATTNAQPGKAKKVTVYRDGTILTPQTKTTVKVKKGKSYSYAYGKTKTIPPGYNKGKKVGWVKGKGNKH